MKNIAGMNAGAEGSPAAIGKLETAEHINIIDFSISQSTTS